LSTRDQFASTLAPEVDDPDLRSYRVIIIRLNYEVSPRLDGRNTSATVSLRHLLLLALLVPSVPESHIVYVCITRNDAPENVCILEQVEYVKHMYRPAESGRPRDLVLEGDQYAQQYILLCETRTRVPNLTSITLCR
jgi:hypothetical protein